MKRSLCMLGLVAGISPWACAQSSQVTIYGVIDVAVEHLTNVGAGGSGLTRMPNLSGSVPSRLGFRGSEDLGNGLRAVFTLEQGFAPDSGVLNQGGRAFGRLAFVGLTGAWGSLTFGRQNSMLFWSLLDADVLAPSLHSTGSFDSYILNPRIDNSVAYRGSYGGLSFGATYSLGRDAVNAGPSPGGTNCPGEDATDSNACKQWSALVKYDSAAWGASLVVDEFRGGPGAFAGLTSSSMKDTRTGINGYAKFGNAKLAAGLIRRKNGADVPAPRSDLWFVGASYAATPQITIDGGLYHIKFNGSNNKSTLGAVRGTYALSKRTAVYATLGRMDNDGTMALSVSGGAPGGNPLAGRAQTGLATGIRHWF